jgi:uncharacterized membrane protein YgdD (TMEM256/DUF423 family)
MQHLWRVMLASGAFSAALAVMLGAFGAHALKTRIDAEMLAVWRTAVEYHFYHSLGLLAVGMLLLHFPQSGALRLAGLLMAAGIVLFSGSLYLLAITGARWLGAITPLGGAGFIAAWVALAVGVLRAS